MCPPFFILMLNGTLHDVITVKILLNAVLIKQKSVLTWVILNKYSNKFFNLYSDEHTSNLSFTN